VSGRFVAAGVEGELLVHDLGSDFRCQVIWLDDLVGIKPRMLLFLRRLLILGIVGRSKTVLFQTLD